MAVPSILGRASKFVLGFSMALAAISCASLAHDESSAPDDSRAQAVAAETAAVLVPNSPPETRGDAASLESTRSSTTSATTPCRTGDAQQIASQAPSKSLIVVGDSVGLEVVSAIEAGGTAAAEYIQSVGARWIKNDDQHAALANGVDELRPGVVVVVIGFWDVTAPFGHPETATPETAAAISTKLYRTELMEFRADLGQGPIVWLLPPPSNWPHLEDGLRRFEEEVAALACSSGDAIVDPREILGETWESESSIAGKQVRLRHDDGVHFCPNGALAVARLLLGHLGWVELPAGLPAEDNERFADC